jgi:hypothetical protein
LALSRHSRANPVSQPFGAVVLNSNPSSPVRTRTSWAVSGRARRLKAADHPPRMGVGPEWHLAKAHISEPERLTHQKWVFGSDVFCLVSQQDRGKRLRFSAVWRLPPQKRIMDREKSPRQYSDFQAFQHSVGQAGISILHLYALLLCHNVSHHRAVGTHSTASLINPLGDRRGPSGMRPYRPLVNAPNTDGSPPSHRLPSHLTSPSGLGRRQPALPRRPPID